LPIFSLLAKHKALPAPLAKRLTAMAGFRNILVHEYLEIDRHRVYRALKDQVGDFEKFIKAVSKF
jgi:uncharacterized protein YutE (UPF0331/DUF86 family)